MLHAQYAFDYDRDTCFLQRFPPSGRHEVFARLGPPRGQVPQLAVSALLHEQELIFPSHHD
jgi:hypothetical protein